MTDKICLYACCYFEKQKDQDTSRESGKERANNQIYNHIVVKGACVFLPHASNYSEPQKLQYVAILSWISYL